MTDLPIPANTQRALELYAGAERERLKGSGVSKDTIKLITWKSLAQHILKNELVKRGYMFQNGKVRE